jgi:hypothetical protein
MTPYFLTPEQRLEWNNAESIGRILSETVATQTTNLLPVRTNPFTRKEAIRFYGLLGAKKPFFQSGNQFVMNCIMYSGEIYAAASDRIILTYHEPGKGLLYWFGNGKPKKKQALPDVVSFQGECANMFAAIMINNVYDKIRPFLTHSFDASPTPTVDHAVLACPSCKQLLRVPSTSNLLRITCPKCKGIFEARN